MHFLWGGGELFSVIFYWKLYSIYFLGELFNVMIGAINPWKPQMIWLYSYSFFLVAVWEFIIEMCQ